MELLDAFQRGLRRVRLPSWNEATYLELFEVGGFLSPSCRLRNPKLEACNIDILHWHPDQHPIYLYRLGPLHEWEEYTGEPGAELPPPA
jgi:hypothetical protein